VIHTTRFDAQLHVIHSSLDSFLKDPVSPEWEGWKKSFNVEQKTDAISKDLESHEELRRAMEKLVPEKADYPSFWCRYYFLRHVIETEEQRRREMLKGIGPHFHNPNHRDSNIRTNGYIASAPIEEEEVGWDDDSEEDSEDDSDDESSTPSKTQAATANLAASRDTLKAADPKDESLKPAQPAEPRRSNDEKSVADSDASYDLVSGATSRAPGSPHDNKKTIAEESDEESEEESEEESSEEEDWE